MPRCFKFFAASLLLLLAAACSGNSTLRTVPDAHSLGGALPVLESLPAPRSSLATTSYDFSGGDLLDSAGANMAGTTLELETAGMSWAVLGGNFPGNTAIQASVSGTLSGLYIMTSDYSSGRWKLLAGPLDAGGSHSLPAGVMRGDDSTFVALLCPPGAAASISVSLLLDDGATPVPQPISGAVRTEADFPLAGVTLTLSGAGNFQATSNAAGNYSFAAVPPGNYTLSAQLDDHAFTPATRNVIVAASPVTGQNFSATLDIDLTPYEFRVGLSFGGNPPVQSVIRLAKGTNIDIYVEPGVGVPGWDPAFDVAFKEAVLNWNALSDPWGLFHIRITDVEDDAEIVVSWIQTFNQGNKLGEAAFAVLSDGSVVLPYTIEMATESEDIVPDAALVRMVAVHEVGHCLGLWGHSDQATDIMFPVVGGFEIPSRRDLWTIYTLYNTPADFTTDGRGPSSFVGPRLLGTYRTE